MQDEIDATIFINKFTSNLLNKILSNFKPILTPLKFCENLIYDSTNEKPKRKIKDVYRMKENDCVSELFSLKKKRKI